MPCCLYPVAEDPLAEAVTTVGTGGATLLRITSTVALEDEELLLLLILVGDILDDIPVSALEEDT